MAEETGLSDGTEAKASEDMEEAAQATDEAERIELNEVEAGEGEEAVGVAEGLEASAAEEETAPTPATPPAPSPEAMQADEEAVPAEDIAAETESAEDLERVTAIPDAADEIPRGPDFYYYGTGRRKTSAAQVRLYPSKESAIIINDKPLHEYFPRFTDVLDVRKPLRVTATEDMFRITVKVRGGGLSGQAGAIRHGIARALTKANPELRRTLRKEGSLTRDPRMKERKKPGLKRARKAPQYTKR